MTKSKGLDMNQKTNNPELAFYFEVLKRMRNNHKNVISDDELNEVRKHYKNYLGMTTPDQLTAKGLFGDV